MRLVKRLLLLGLLLAATLPLGSCGRAVERARERIRLEAVESVRRLGFSGAEAVVRVRNDSRSRLVLNILSQIPSSAIWHSLKIITVCFYQIQKTKQIIFSKR